MLAPTATKYPSRNVKLAPDFLSIPSLASDARPVIAHRIDFRSTPLRTRGTAYAVVLDNVLSPSECKILLALAEEASGPWAPALLNMGRGLESPAPEYRNSERIVWDHSTVVERLWKRCLTADGLAADISILDDSKLHVLGPYAEAQGRWRSTRLNDRMRFLRYEPGMFFREHCDGSYRVPETGERSFFTLQLYLNDSEEGLSTSAFHIPTNHSASRIEQLPQGSKLSGGATTFHTDDMLSRIDVFPRAGRVLIFQHYALLHSGADVQEGVKYTMRTDLMFERMMESHM